MVSARRFQQSSTSFVTVFGLLGSPAEFSVALSAAADTFLFFEVSLVP